MNKEELEKHIDGLDGEDQLFCEFQKELIAVINRYQKSLPMQRIIRILILTGYFHNYKLHGLEDGLDIINDIINMAISQSERIE